MLASIGLTVSPSRVCRRQGRRIVMYACGPGGALNTNQEQMFSRLLDYPPGLYEVIQPRTTAFWFVAEQPMKVRLGDQGRHDDAD